MSTEITLDYSQAGVPIRANLQETHRAILEHLCAAGSWFSGETRRAIAEESRAAESCPLCLERKAALSPEHPSGDHARVTDLPESLVEIAHRIRVDSGRLSRGWFDRQIASGTSDGEYVEAVGIVALTAGLDAFCVGAGIRRFALPVARAGEPSRHRPANVVSGIAWVPILAPEDATGPEADLYREAAMIPNIVRALSLVPDHVRILQIENHSHYIPIEDMTNPAVSRDLDRLQIELVAARVSALNECFY